jgi:hypothetical protein
MGRNPAEQLPDLFSTSSDGDASAPAKPRSPESPADTSPQRHVLPKNLRHAVKHLSDGELDRVFEVAFDEAKRRGRLPRSIGQESTHASRHSSDLLPQPSSAAYKAIHQRKVDVTERQLTRGQINAVRAAFKAGVTPSRIARQFGITHSQVRNALATNEPKQ